MQIRTLMSSPAVSVTPTDTIIKAVDLMRRHAIGMLPVLDGRRPVGILTDRDIVMRALDDLQDPRDHLVRDVMSIDPVFCGIHQTVAEAAAIMGDEQVRRILVLDDSERVAGVLSVGDIARDASEELAGQALGEIIERRKSASR